MNDITNLINRIRPKVVKVTKPDLNARVIRISNLDRTLEIPIQDSINVSKSTGDFG